MYRTAQRAVATTLRTLATVDYEGIFGRLVPIAEIRIFQAFLNHPIEIENQST